MNFEQFDTSHKFGQYDFKLTIHNYSGIATKESPKILLL